jgi:SPOR domain
MTMQTPTRPAPPAEELECPRCGAPYEPLQEYCLECGLRLPTTGGVVETLRSGWMRRWAWYPGDWIWVVLLSFVVAAVGAALAILLSRPTHSGRTLVETSHVTSKALPTEAPTLTTGTLPTAPTATQPPTTTAAPPPPPRNAVLAWPNRNGYTVVLNSIPTANGRSAAVAQAKQAGSRGLRQVGVLDSSRYSSLHPGYYVVFSGIYSSLSAAQAAVSRARSAGYGAAYARQITT